MIIQIVVKRGLQTVGKIPVDIEIIHHVVHAVGIAFPIYVNTGVVVQQLDTLDCRRIPRENTNGQCHQCRK